MVDPVIQANDSLVLNGDFSQGISQWTRGANPREVTIESEIYEGLPIRFLSAGNLGSAWQEVTVPVEPGDNAGYLLSFLYETRHTDAARLLVTAADGSPLAEIQLPPGSPRDLAEDQARIDSGQPLDFRPISYNAPLDLPLQRHQRIRITVVAPRNVDPEDYHLRVCITRIHLGLILAPLKLQMLKLDDQHFSPNGLLYLYLCLGADGGFQHRLECVPETDSPWLGTKAALTSIENPQGAVTALPDWDVDHPLDLPWVLQCPLIGDQDAYPFTVNLVSQYTADPYPVRVSLGHHRLVFREVQEAAYYPVLELAQSVRVGVQVASWYTGKLLAGRTVTWSIPGQGTLGTTSTDSEGWAYFDYLPQVAGDFVIHASVISLYYVTGVETTTLNIRVLATDPWKDVLAVVDGSELPWTQKTGYPNRGSTYPMIIRLPEVLLGSELAMRWEGDSAAQLGVQVLPELEQSVPVGQQDLPWQLICQDELDGRFQLQLLCSKLLLPSGKKPMSLARNRVRIGEVQEANKFPVVDEQESVLLRVQVVHEVVSGEGDPVNNALVDWQTAEGTISTHSGVGGWASVLYQPSSHGDLRVTASVRAHAEAVAVERQFAVKALARSPWKNQIRILFDDVEVDLADLGLLCWRGNSHKLRIEPSAGSSMLNQVVTLQWRGETPDIGLNIPGIGVPELLESKGLEWAFSSQAAASTSGMFTLQLVSPVLASPRELFGRLISSQLEDELTVMLDQVPGTQADAALFPCLGARHTFRFLPNALSPLVGLEGFLDWQGTSAPQLGATVEPPLDVPQRLADGGIGWALDFTSSTLPGEFALLLRLPGLSTATPLRPMQLDHNKLRIEDARVSQVDPVINQDAAWQWLRVVSTFTGQAVGRVPVQWSTSAGNGAANTDEFGWAGFALAPLTAGLHDVVGQVRSRFDGYEEQRSFVVTALELDPWEGVRVSFDGQGYEPWGGRTFFPRRKGEHVIELTFSENNPLLQQQLTLGLTGTGPAELGMRFEPALGLPRQVIGLGFRYVLRCDDVKDGGFALRLGAQRLARLSPANAMSLGVGSQVLKILANSSVQQVLEWDQELIEQVKVVASTTGKSIAGILVTWRNKELGMVTSLTDFYGIATVRFKPQTPGAAVVTATVGDEVYSESADLAYTLEEPRVISELYEPEDSRLPPNEERAQAIAKVVSARTGLPLAGVQVQWDFAGSALTPSVTDEEGLARLTFTYPADEEGVLTAVVRGGGGGWDMAQLDYLGIVPEIESLTSPEQNIFPGQDIIADVTVVSLSDGKPLAGIKISWAFSGQDLPSTKSGADGKSRIVFKPLELGAFVLTATVGFQNSKSMDFIVGYDVELKGLAVDSSAIELLKPYSAQVRVLNRTSGRPQANIEVAWSLTAHETVVRITDADGWSRHPFVATEHPEKGIASLSASVGRGPDITSVGADVWVSDFNNRVMKEVDLLIENNRVTHNFNGIRLFYTGSEITVQGFFPESWIGEECSIGCTHPDVTFMPAVGVTRKIEERYVTWKMIVQAPVGTQYSFALYCRGIVGSNGARCRAIAGSNNEGVEDK